MNQGSEEKKKKTKPEDGSKEAAGRVSPWLGGLVFVVVTVIVTVERGRTQETGLVNMCLAKGEGEESCSCVSMRGRQYRYLLLLLLLLHIRRLGHCRDFLVALPTAPSAS